MCLPAAVDVSLLSPCDAVMNWRLAQVATLPSPLDCWDWIQQASDPECRRSADRKELDRAAVPCSDPAAGVTASAEVRQPRPHFFHRAFFYLEVDPTNYDYKPTG